MHHGTKTFVFLETYDVKIRFYSHAVVWEASEIKMTIESLANLLEILQMMSLMHVPRTEL